MNKIRKILDKLDIENTMDYFYNQSDTAQMIKEKTDELNGKYNTKRKFCIPRSVFRDEKTRNEVYEYLHEHEKKESKETINTKINFLVFFLQKKDLEN